VLKGETMPIIKTNKPNFINNEWVLEYIIQDKDAGNYTQKVRFEVYVSLLNYLKMLKENVK